MADVTYQCSYCQQTLLVCRGCGLIMHVDVATHVCRRENAGKMRQCPYQVVECDVPRESAHAG